jgi:hypothetical protein
MRFPPFRWFCAKGPHEDTRARTHAGPGKFLRVIPGCSLLDCRGSSVYPVPSFIVETEGGVGRNGE